MPPHGHTAGKSANFKLGHTGIASSALDQYGEQFLWIDQSSTTASDFFNTNSSGGGASHNNMQPYLAVYIWERTA